MQITPTKTLRIAGALLPDQWLSALADPIWLADSELFKQDGASWVRRATILNRDVVVKCRPLNSLRKRIQSRLRHGHGDRQWIGAGRLQRANIKTATPLLLFRARVDDVECEILVLAHVAGRSLLDHLNDIARNRGPGVRVQHRLAEAVAKTIPALLKARLWNRDHKPSNLIVTFLDDRQVDIAVIDCVGVELYWAVDSGEGEEMAASLLIEPIGCGCPPRRALWMRALHQLASEHRISPEEWRPLRRSWVETLSGEIAAHGDPTPRINPLSPTAPPGLPPR